MIRFAEVFPDEKIVNALSTQLGWTHFRHIEDYLEVPVWNLKNIIFLIDKYI
jgi:hypothetical protein